MRKEDPVIPSASLARCLGRVAQGDVEFAWQLHPECELCLRRAPIPRGGTRVPHISPWYGSGPCPDRVVEV